MRSQAATADEFIGQLRDLVNEARECGIDLVKLVQSCGGSSRPIVLDPSCKGRLWIPAREAARLKGISMEQLGRDRRAGRIAADFLSKRNSRVFLYHRDWVFNPEN